MRTGVMCPKGIICQYVNRNRKRNRGLRFFGSSNHYDPRIFGTRLTGEFVSSIIITLGYATHRPTFVFSSDGFINLVNAAY